MSGAESFIPYFVNSFSSRIVKPQTLISKFQSPNSSRAPMTERTAVVTPTDVRYGFNGKEKDNETFSGAYDFGARMYDSRLGRWWSVDKKVSVNYDISSYCTLDNNPICMIDPTGDDAIVSISGNTITFKAVICIHGEGATNAKAKEMQAQIMQVWGKNFKYFEGDKEYNVKFDIQVVNTEAESEGDPTLGPGVDPLFWTGAENWINIENREVDFRSFVRDGNTGTWSSKESGNTYAHEVGHLLGIADSYIDVKMSQAFCEMYGYSDEQCDEVESIAISEHGKTAIMGLGSRVTQIDIDALADLALKIIATDNSVIDAGKYRLNAPKATEIQPYLGSGQFDLVTPE
jgi:RHS repeat-associated protein